MKQFAQRMVTDHSKANDELKSLAQSKNITLPTDVDAKDKATHDRLAKLSGAAFDRAYMQTCWRITGRSPNEFKKESTSGKDADVKALGVQDAADDRRAPEDGAGHQQGGWDVGPERRTKTKAPAADSRLSTKADG